jgi:hypothetical protein
MPINTRHKTDRTVKALNWFGQIYGLPAFLKAALFLSLLFNFAHTFSATIPAGQSVKLAWIPSADADVMGYNIYYGVASHTYLNKVNVGNVTNASISGLITGVTYFFSATAYDNLGQESDFSDEVSYLIPNKSPTVQIQGMVAGQFAITVQGQTGNTYDILATQDFRAWTIVGTVTIGANGSSNFADTNAANFAQRFYRTQANTTD